LSSYKKNRNRIRLFTAICCTVFCTSLFVFAEKPKNKKTEKIGFNKYIRPILSENCFACHGPGTQKAKLRIDRREGALAKRKKGGHAIVPGDPGKSLLIQRITETDPDELMPPEDSHKKLSNKEKALLKQWILEGAIYEPHWAYIKAKKHPIPQIKNNKWPINWVDNFILSRLESENVAPSAEADKVTLIRRLSFDLTGLPPSYKEVDDFLADKSPKAYQKAVDRLLASPHFGERLAMYWLDLVRYADTVGYHGDQDHNISPYRDWVIKAFNDNMSFDIFTRLQLAGDLEKNRTRDQHIASGYNRLLQTTHEGGLQVKEYLAIYAADRIRNFSGVWLGSTLGCAQCHDHKYDPFTSKDFYSAVAFFADVDGGVKKFGGNSLPTKRPPEIWLYTKEQEETEKALNKELKKLKEKYDKQRKELKKNNKKKLAGLKKKYNKEKRSLDVKLATLRKHLRKTMVTVSGKPRVIRILPRGNWLDETGPIMTPAIPEFMGSLKIKGRRANRQDLAKWITSKDNPLTARVFANRMWYLFFGSGINKNLDDFGGQGELPSHPKLLDRLAIKFSDDWDVKSLIRFMVMSRTYRQSSLVSYELAKKDPLNKLFARQGRFRLPAEMVRDNALAISGLLVRDIGGPSVKPYQPAGYYRHFNFPKRKYSHHKDKKQWRRGVYVHWQRQFLHPMLKAFDAPSREECTAKRPRSNTPLAALSLLNDPSMVEASRMFAERILKSGKKTDEEKIKFAFKASVSHGPDMYERKMLLKLLKKRREEFSKNKKAVDDLLKTGQHPVDKKLDKVEVAAWTSVARVLLNLNETITRN